MVDTLPVMADRKAPSTENARIDRDIMRKARIVSARKGMTMPEYLASVLGPIVDADYAVEAMAMAKEVSKGRKKPD